MSDGVDLDEVYAFAVELGKEAGALLLTAAQARYGDGLRPDNGFDEKESAVDIVTRTDEGQWYEFGQASHLYI